MQPVYPGLLSLFQMYSVCVLTVKVTCLGCTTSSSMVKDLLVLSQNSMRQRFVGLGVAAGKFNMSSLIAHERLI